MPLVEGSDGDISGMAATPAVRQALAALKTTAGRDCIRIWLGAETREP